MLEILGYFGDEILNKHIVDNSCGDGAFLSEIVRRYLLACKNHDKNVIKTELETFIHGIEIDNTQLEKCVKNLDKIKQFEFSKSGMTDILSHFTSLV
ncbi:hypothetical protein [Campylobacter gastrosuis]|uniref:DNA methylase adenine-specific domain-containing protein n=1 Tax=Campylobacter gastrosuis TaxID=2974576 RepID=A0ABT7HPM4_9BACT|nr:hypothetical protein [Campylobacter gastrosuis]MDL0088794.1 hypothetical protein [Campylobacter gastrosuis]